MALLVDWLTNIITVPKTDLILDSGTRYTITVDALLALLQDRGDDEDAMSFSTLHTNIPPTASTPRTVEVNDPYTWAFEDGLYSVSILNGNTNYRDVEVRNQTSVQTNNTTGFIDPQFLEAGLFPGGIVIDVANGYAGTDKTAQGGVIGTRETPSNNLADAKVIAQDRGYKELLIRGNITIGATDVLDDYIMEGENSSQSVITFITGSDTDQSSFHKACLTGDLSGALFVSDCALINLTGVGSPSSVSRFNDCSFDGGYVRIRTSNTKEVHFVSCESGNLNNPVSIDVNHSLADITFRQFSGPLSVLNITKDIIFCYDSTGAELIIESSCTAGTVIVRGTAKIIDNSGVDCTIIDETTAQLVWDVDINLGKIDSYGELLDALIKYDKNKTKIDPTAKTLTVYDDDNSTPIAIFDLKDSTGAPSVTEVFERVPQ